MSKETDFDHARFLTAGKESSGDPPPPSSPGDPPSSPSDPPSSPPDPPLSPGDPISSPGDPPSPSAHDQEMDQAAIILDAQDSERQYHRAYGVQREIWRPGDGDGDPTTEYWERKGAPLPLEQRWRLYQSTTGNGAIEFGVNEPPKHVMLDDYATQELYASNIPRAYLSRNWQHDFASQGRIRPKRPHRGRPAIGDENASGDDRYHFAVINKDITNRYYFTGEASYRPIIYTNPPATTLPSPLPPKRPASPKTQTVLKTPRSHNQHTPKDLLVKYGAPSSSKDGRAKRADVLHPRRLPGYVAPSYGESVRAQRAGSGFEAAEGEGEGVEPALRGGSPFPFPFGPAGAAPRKWERGDDDLDEEYADLRKALPFADRDALDAAEAKKMLEEGRRSEGEKDQQGEALAARGMPRMGYARSVAEAVGHGGWEGEGRSVSDMGTRPQDEKGIPVGEVEVGVGAGWGGAGGGGVGKPTKTDAELEKEVLELKRMVAEQKALIAQLETGAKATTEGSKEWKMIGEDGKAEDRLETGRGMRGT